MSVFVKCERYLTKNDLKNMIERYNYFIFAKCNGGQFKYYFSCGCCPPMEPQCPPFCSTSCPPAPICCYTCPPPKSSCCSPMPITCMPCPPQPSLLPCPPRPFVCPPCTGHPCITCAPLPKPVPAPFECGPVYRAPITTGGLFYVGTIRCNPCLSYCC